MMSLLEIFSKGLNLKGHFVLDVKLGVNLIGVILDISAGS